MTKYPYQQIKYLAKEHTDGEPENQKKQNRKLNREFIGMRHTN